MDSNFDAWELERPSVPYRRARSSVSSGTTPSDFYPTTYFGYSPWATCTPQMPLIDPANSSTPGSRSSIGSPWPMGCGDDGTAAVASSIAFDANYNGLAILPYQAQPDSQQMYFPLSPQEAYNARLNSTPAQSRLCSPQTAFPPMGSLNRIDDPFVGTIQQASTPVPAVVVSPCVETPAPRLLKRSYEQMSLSPNVEEDTPDVQPCSKRRARDPHRSETLLACPYWKRFPAVYAATNEHQAKYRKCSCVRIANLSRLKQHLYRNHAPPKHYCRRCFATFDSAQLCSDHSQATPACAIGRCPWPEQINDDQRERISRKCPGLSDYDGWYMIWNILFPGVPRPSTPYPVDSYLATTPVQPQSQSQPHCSGNAGPVYFDPTEASPDRTHLKQPVLEASQILQQISFGQAGSQPTLRFGKEQLPSTADLQRDENDFIDSFNSGTDLDWS